MHDLVRRVPQRAGGRGRDVHVLAAHGGGDGGGAVGRGGAAGGVRDVAERDNRAGGSDGGCAECGRLCCDDPYVKRRLEGFIGGRGGFREGGEIGLEVSELQIA